MTVLQKQTGDFYRRHERKYFVSFFLAFSYEAPEKNESRNFFLRYFCFFVTYCQKKIAFCSLTPSSMYPRVTIVGRPNVGKSSIFNALAGHRIAIVSDIENTTRDIIEHDIYDSEYQMRYIVSDSGGIVIGTDEAIFDDVRSRVDDAISRSDLILFVVEYDRLTELDELIVRKLRKSGKKIIVLANKADNANRALESYEHLSLGLGVVIPVSAIQSRGFGQMRAEIAEILQALGHEKTEEAPVLDEGLLKLAIIGRPNV